MNSLMGSHADADQVPKINNIRISALQVDRLHRIHVMNIDSAVNGIVSMTHIESVVTQDNLVAYGFPLGASVEPLVQPTVSSERAFAHSLLDSKIAVAIEVAFEREEFLSRPQTHRGTPSWPREPQHTALRRAVQIQEQTHGP